MLFIIPDALNIKSVIGFSSLYTIHSNNYDDGIYWAFFHMNIYDMIFNLKLELLIKSIDNRIILLSIFVIWYVLTMWKYQTRKTCLSNFRFKCDTMLYLYIKQSKHHDMCLNVLKKKMFSWNWVVVSKGFVLISTLNK